MKKMILYGFKIPNPDNQKINNATYDCSENTSQNCIYSTYLFKKNGDAKITKTCYDGSDVCFQKYSHIVLRLCVRAGFRTSFDAFCVYLSSVLRIKCVLNIRRKRQTKYETPPDAKLMLVAVFYLVKYSSLIR